MMNDSPILIISTIADAATDSVVQSLERRDVPCLRINTEDFPFDGKLTLDYQGATGASMSFNGRPSSPRAIWYRRVRTPARPEGLDPGIYDFCLRETRAVLVGGLLTQSSRWMSHPGSVWRAEFKPLQLQVAQSVGLRIPRTIVSNDAAEIRRAFDEFGSLIVKPARSGHFWRGGEEFSIYTSALAKLHLDELDTAQWAPSIYQEHLPKQFDVRVTCVGDKLFCVAIHSQTDPAASVDWRRTENPALPHSQLELPPEIQRQIYDLMQLLDLQFGCLDFVLTSGGEFVFLEVNPSGQWLWLDDQLELGISDEVARWLADGASSAAGA